ncbi:cytochrome P450 family 71 protein [Medicago truncatula]|uniref:Cytochrome P450 family 71 protein n=1 Tax=Medicago truncatula TaxID=3880 RepID=A0A072UHH4_MEDTR|nr:cytochrome P450 family 71 protein [Medicago truncatula]
MLPFLLVLCLIFPLLFFFLKRSRNINARHPPGPRGLPIIGNLHQLDNSILYLQLSKLSKIYGPIFSLKLGLRPAIVVSSDKIAKEIFKNNDHVFSNRPMLYGQQRLSYNGSEIVFSQYSDFWRDIRKICVIHIFSAKRVSYYSSIRKFEVKQMIKNISNHAASSIVTNLSEILTSLSSTIICRIAFGRSYEDEGTNKRSKFHGMLHEFEAMLTALFISDYIPFTGWIDKLSGLRARLERNFKEMDEFYQEVIDEHLDPNRQHEDDEEVIVDVLLQLKKERLFPIDLTFDHIKGVLMNMLVAATGTTSATAVWAMTALIKNPRVMKKVQQEIRNSRVKKEFIDEDDIRNLSYLKAVIKETLRLYLPAPLLAPRETTEKCTINGFQIPAKAIVFVNAWAIHTDSNVWKNPEEFYPERFLESSLNFHGQDFELIPFGAGRRICPGMSMAVASLELILSNLLYSFDWELPDGLIKEDIDTERWPGLTQHKKNELCLAAKIPM